MHTKNGVVYGAGSFSRRQFLRLGGAGLAGMALLGAGAGCGGGGGQSGDLVFAMGTDTSGTLDDLVNKFNEQNKGEFQVRYRQMPSDTGQYFDQLRTELQAGASEIDVIGGDVIWPAQFAANGWILDLSDRFTGGMQQEYLDGPLGSVHYEGKVWGVPWFTDAGMFTTARTCLRKAASPSPQRPGTR